ncbi:MAG: hypothetical protein E4H14_17185 [Candidatus Thorarchaeota archaeon]|nr:MAG: hypothetical protein E4H14_17185 [Candidatus Thorarchaeota archaeon]
MIEEQYEEVFEILNFEMTRKDIVILGAILKSQSDPSVFVDFEDIRAQLAIEEGGKKGKDSLIYRSLSGLERTGFIRVDRSEHKHGYNTDVGLMNEVFRKAIRETTAEIGKELVEIDAEIEQISNIDLGDLASDMILLAAGKQKIEKPIFAEGWENVLQLIDDKVYSHVKKGDRVRFSLEWLSRPDMITPLRVDRLGKLMENGVIFLGLEHNKVSKQQRDLFKKFTFAFREKGYQPGFRICVRKDSTYQFVGRNDEGIVLIVSENPMSATWIPRSANPDLVDNAIETFDTDYDAGEDIADIGGD